MILSGHIESRDYPKEEIVQGLQVMRYDWQMKKFSVGVLDHILTSGNWYFIREDLEGGSEIMELDRLCYPVFVPFPVDGPEIKIKFGQWVPILRNEELDKGIIIEADIKSVYFYKGSSSVQCKYCGNDFQGSIKQKTCEECCKKQSVAVIIPRKRFHLAASTRKDLYNKSDMCKLVEEFMKDMGLESTQFPIWLNKKEQKQLKDEEG